METRSRSERTPSTGLRAHGEPGTSHGWNRYAFRHAKVLVDKLDGEIGAIVDSKRTLPEDAAPAIAAAALDAYVNSTYRSLKAHRLGEVIGAHLDAAEAASHLLDALFALRGRVRPWSKYLRWELELEPLGAGAAWRADVFLERLERLLQEPSPAAPATALPRRRGARPRRRSCPVIDSWGPSLPLLRGTIEDERPRRRGARREAPSDRAPRAPGSHRRDRRRS